MKKDKTHDEESAIIDIKFHIVFFVLVILSILANMNFAWLPMNHFVNTHVVLAVIAFMVYAMSWFVVGVYGFFCVRPVIVFGSMALFVYCQYC